MLLLPGIPERPVAVIPVRQVVAILAEHPAAATPGLRRPSREVIREVVAVTAAVVAAAVVARVVVQPRRSVTRPGDARRAAVADW